MALKRAVLLQTLAGGLLGFAGLLGEQDSLDVGENTTLGDGHSREQLVQLLVVADGQLQMTGDDPRLLVVASGVTCQLEHLSCEVLHHCCQVDWGYCNLMPSFLVAVYE